MERIDITPADIETAKQRSQSFVHSIPAELSAQERRIVGDLERMNASPRSKLRKIYTVLDAFSNVMQPYVACRRGCSDCCHMNVSVTALEAEQIGQATGRRPVQLSRPIEHPIERHLGKPCPFLEDNACSIYEHRPFACRAHASFFETSKACDPRIPADTPLPEVEFSGLLKALKQTARSRTGLVFADIRDFFPT